MAKPKNPDQITPRQASAINKSNRKISGNINQLMDNLHNMTYGIDRNDKVDSLMSDFNALMKTEVDTISKASGGDTTSLITKLVSDRRKHNISSMADLENLFTSQSEENLESIFNEQYRNRLLKQADLQEVASQLVELQEAVTITRDSIIASDIVDGHMSRNLKVSSNKMDDENDQYIPILQEMERKFELQEKIKNFIIPHSLIAGEYYSYTIPYSVLFSEFMKEKLSNGGKQYRAYESVMEGTTLYDAVSKTKYNKMLEAAYESVAANSENGDLTPKKKTEINDELKSYMENIIINNNHIPLPVIEEGIATMRQYFKDHADEVFMEAKPEKAYSFDTVMKGIDTGIHPIKDTSDKDIKKDTDFSNIKDCYVKLIDARHLLPIEIMNEPIGYFYVQEEDVTAASGILTSTVYYNKFDNPGQQNILNTIADSIVDAFDKKFLEKNEKFKNLIVETISYYKLHNKKLKFQFIPKEYIIPFKVNKDENGHGVSILEPSLFYAKLYLMLLLFKIYSIVQNGNDTKVNYIRQSGLDKNLINKVQDIARKKQQQHINLADMFTYTSVINKIGRGNEMFVPMGKSNERTIETEILAGQDVPLHNELMDSLKKSYISSTGVPDVLLNYYNEAEFAKTIELANNRYQGRVVSCQLDYNHQITAWYRQIARFSTTIPEHIIDTIEFSFIQPKASNANVTNDLLNNHNTLSEFLIQLFKPDQDVPTEIQQFRLALAKDRLSMLDWDNIEKLWKESQIRGIDDELNPDNAQSNDDAV